MNNNVQKPPKYIYDLPYAPLKAICRMLDIDNKWEELAGKYMGYDLLVIKELEREILIGRSPTDALLYKWGNSNHTILELFKLFSKMQHYRAMLPLKPYVDPIYHQLIYEGEENLQLLGMPRPEYKPQPSCPNSNLMSVGSSGLQSVAAGMESPTQPVSATFPSNRNLNIGSQDINMQVTKSKVYDKVMFLPKPEKKINNSEVAIGATNIPVPQRLESKPLNLLPAPVPGISDKNTQRKLSNASDNSSVADSCGAIPSIDYEELKAATNHWDKANILGKGGFGTVFKGLWKNTQVAIKRIDQKGEESAESYQAQLMQSMRELRVLNTCRHDNILSLYGFSIGGEQPCLVYQFMPNGSLEDRLLKRQRTPPLTWTQRHSIAEGTARGLQFLHCSNPPFIHGDIKSANILLDTNFTPRIGDFGLAREGPASHYTHKKVSRVVGTKPYLPVEFLKYKKLSTKVDSYSFGIVLFELATGQRAYDEARVKKYLVEHVLSCPMDRLSGLYDMTAGTGGNELFLKLVDLGKKCVQQNAKDRPEMETVLKQLEELAQEPWFCQLSNIGNNSPPTPLDLQEYYDNFPKVQVNNHGEQAHLPTCLPRNQSPYLQRNGMDNQVAVPVEELPTVRGPTPRSQEFASKDILKIVQEQMNENRSLGTSPRENAAMSSFHNEDSQESPAVGRTVESGFLPLLSELGIHENEQGPTSVTHSTNNILPEEPTTKNKSFAI